MDRGRPGSKHHLLVDASGIPLAWSLTGGNRNDVTKLIPLLDAVPAVAGLPGRPRQRPASLVGDRGYDHDKYRRLLRQRGIEPLIARRQSGHGSGLGRVRWVVGAWMVPPGFGFLLAGMLTPMLAKRFRPGFVMSGGLALSAVAYSVLTRVDETSATALIAFAFAVFAFGVTPVFALATDMIVGAAPRERAGAASAISETGAEFGGALGIAVFGSIGVAVYRSRLADGVPAGLPAEQAEIARDTLGGANEVAAQLPDYLGASLLESARDAFSVGLRVTAVTGAVLLAALAVLVAILLRDVRPAAEAESELEAAGVPVPAS